MKSLTVNTQLFCGDMNKQFLAIKKLKRYFAFPVLARHSKYFGRSQNAKLKIFANNLRHI